ncbi:alpha/beta hydrolase [Croceivirga sp. JEA036]|uniref:alpha/beta hydrolase n=1 Tax=Croceivirga sp. JEA036 TaxID=2721162 RepID=UPI00143BFD11|nr:alpha/beta hydrolase [Croceivirga sp. JEA036]NJB38077.1 alpha/beta hydrolase [Croceivirga sp. JEA036]
MRLVVQIVIAFIVVTCSAQHKQAKIMFNYDGVSFKGILSYPESKKPMPLAIFIPGSGPVDMDGNQKPMLQADYILQLADSLNNRGIAFWRFDKAAVLNDIIAKKPELVFEDLVQNVGQMLTHFEDNGNFSGYHILGHSQGSLVGMLQKHPKIKSFTSIAGPANSIDTILIHQIKKQSPELAAIASKHFKELMATDTIQELNPMLFSIFAPQNQKFIRSWANYNPAEELKKLELPVLILNGDLDIQVSITEAEALYKASPKATYQILDNTTHVLKEVALKEKGLETYTNPNFPISPQLINAIEKFIKLHE